MFLRLLILLMIITIVHSAFAVGGWHASGKGRLQSKMLRLARQQLYTTTNFTSEPIQILNFETQIVAGTNLRLVFNVGGKHQCTLLAFKPLPYTRKRIQVTSFTCADVTSPHPIPTK